MKCSKCGNELKDTDTICSNCGANNEINLNAKANSLCSISIILWVLPYIFINFMGKFSNDILRTVFRINE